jgi:hypothetical protein
VLQVVCIVLAYDLSCAHQCCLWCVLEYLLHCECWLYVNWTFELCVDSLFLRPAWALVLHQDTGKAAASGKFSLLADT